MTNKITSFTQLNAWQKGHELVKLIYKETDSFPHTEKYSLIDQMRRSAISITSNIAEGFSRQSRKEKLQFYFMSKGSLTELQNQLLIARDIQYINNSIFQSIADETVVVHKLINGLIKSAKSKSM